MFAKKNKGKFILRIEDTDKSRCIAGGVEAIIEVLNKVGLKYDEGPYIQSTRLDIYKKYAKKLVQKGKAYYCFCSPERLEEIRQKQIAENKPPMYDGNCRKLSQKQVRENLKNNLPYVIRLKVPQKRITVVNDIIRGKVKFENKFIDDQILLKSDGYPTYHLANVVDDHLMRITHVIRGEEWLPSTPKHVLLYKAFGWKMPKFAHLPLLLNPDRTKLSKRQGDVAVEDYLKKGYLPEALINFVALLGFNPSSHQEIYSLDELIKAFDLKKINKTGAIFNLEKLDWLNGEYIRKKTIDELLELCKPFLPKGFSDDYLRKVVQIEKDRLKKLSDITFLTEFFFKETLEYIPELLIWKNTTKENTKEILEKLLSFLESLPEEDFVKDKLEQRIKGFIQQFNFGVGNVLWPMRVALSGRQASPGPFEIAEILGKEKVLKRIKEAIVKLQS